VSYQRKVGEWFFTELLVIFIYVAFIGALNSSALSITLITDQGAPTVTFLTCIREVLGLNVGWDVGYLE
jgi:hypothetical protein